VSHFLMENSPFHCPSATYKGSLPWSSWNIFATNEFRFPLTHPLQI
jgi:hypothetical protein